MELLRYPDVFTAASASSAVTAWHHYDTIYTERYMWIPQENKEGYEAGNAMKYAKNLNGRLLLYYGTADNNVHPNNSMQLIRALQAGGEELRSPGGAGRRAQRREQPAHDGVLHREPHPAPRPAPGARRREVSDVGRAFRPSPRVSFGGPP